MFGYCVDRIYHIELEIKENTDTSMSASYLKKSLKIMSSLNSKKEKDINTNNGLQQNTTLKNKDYETRTQRRYM